MGVRRERSGHRERLLSKRTPLPECSEGHFMSIPCRADTWDLPSGPVQGVKVVCWLPEEPRLSWLQCHCLHAHRPEPACTRHPSDPVGAAHNEGPALGAWAVGTAQRGEAGGRDSWGPGEGRDRPAEGYSDPVKGTTGE